MPQIQIDLSQSLQAQMSRLQEQRRIAQQQAVSQAVLAVRNEQDTIIRLEAKRLESTQNRIINDKLIKALMLKFSIDEYYEAGEATPKFTYSELTKKKSNFGRRHIDKFVPGLGIPAIVAGSVVASLIFFGVIVPPFGLSLLAAAAIAAGIAFAISAIIAGVTYLVQSSKENKVIAQHQADIEEVGKQIEMDANANMQQVQGVQSVPTAAIVAKLNPKQSEAKALIVDEAPTALDNELRALQETNFITFKNNLKRSFTEAEVFIVERMMNNSEKLNEMPVSKADVDGKQYMLYGLREILDIFKQAYGSDYQMRKEKVTALCKNFESMDLKDLEKRKDKEMKAAKEYKNDKEAKAMPAQRPALLSPPAKVEDFKFQMKF